MNSTPSTDLVTVLGATGGIGHAILDQLLTTEGRQVRAVSRSATAADFPVGVERMDSDMMDAASVKEACAGSAVVVMAAQPPYPEWVEKWPTMLENVIAGAGSAGARLVFVDNLYAYAPASGVLTERSPEHATDPKGKLRAKLGQRLLAAHRAGEVTAVIGRFSDYFGPGATNSGLYMMALAPASKGKTMRGLFDLEQPHAFHYLPDAAGGFVKMIDDPAGDGHIWLLPTTPAKTQRQVLETVNEVLPKAVKISKVGPLAVRVGGWFNPMIRESRSVSVQYDRLWDVDGTGFEGMYGTVQLTPLRQALEHTMSALLRD